MRASSLLSQILGKYGRSEFVHVSKPLELEEKIDAIVRDGNTALQIITDFDGTITRTRDKDGNPCDYSSYLCFVTSSLVPEDVRTTATQLFQQYNPIETDPSLTNEEKTPHMLEWYKKSRESIVHACPRISKETMNETVRLSTTRLRDGAKEMLQRLSSVQVPVLVLSAGIGDVVQEVLLQNEIYYPNVKLVSNFLKFDDQNFISGYNEPFIHMYNKNEASSHSHCSPKDNDTSPLSESSNSRPNVILMGDHLGDSSMDYGMQGSGTTIKIGFLNNSNATRDSVERFTSKFDIVLVDDQSMDFPSILLGYVIN